jgi:glycosyltransferase A (GT-A) superfamily protein (DUF2064 family)
MTNMMTTRTSKQRTILAVYCRRPDTKNVKTRLARGIGDRFARRFYAGCLESLRQDIHILRRSFDIVICPSDESDAGWAERFFPQHDRIVPQIFGGLGLRLEHTDLTLRCLGYERIILIGSDAPSLPLSYLDDIDHRLNRDEVALGPCADGGVYAIGSRITLLPMRDIPWGTEAVFIRLKERFEAKGARVGTMSTWYDVDRADDLEQVRDDLSRSPLPHRRDLGALIDGILTEGTIGEQGQIGQTFIEIETNPMIRNGGEE